METKTNPNAKGVQIFQNPAFGQMRVQSTEKGEALFCLTDVCQALGLGNASQAKTRLKEKGIISSDTLTAGGVQQMLFIDEPNLYRCIFQSRKKEAEAFQDWVVEEVLPSIRKTGGYVTNKATKPKLRKALDVYSIEEFSSPYGYIRVTTVEGEVMFCFPDIWRCLGISNGTALKNKLNPNGFRYLETPTNGGVHLLSYIDEPNLSRIFARRSSKDMAIFKAWIESEVLPVMRSEPKAIEPEIIEEVKELPESIPMKLCPELAEIIGGTVILIQQLERYKTIAGIDDKNVMMNVATNSMNVVKDSLATLYQEAYITDLERKLI